MNESIDQEEKIMPIITTSPLSTLAFLSICSVDWTAATIEPPPFIRELERRIADRTHGRGQTRTVPLVVGEYCTNDTYGEQNPVL
jgi:hypothetical protein